MLDFETWGTSVGCAIRSIGSISFDPYSRKIDPQGFYANVDDASQQAHGLVRDPGTVEWWSKQSNAAQQALGSDQKPIEEVLQKWINWWLSQGAERIWSQGANFDAVILEYLLKKVMKKSQAPWKFWNVRDTRTVYDMFSFDARSLPNTGTAHNALDDCKYQIQCIWAAQEQGRKRWAS